MRGQEVMVKGQRVRVLLPSRQDILALQVGDLAVDCFGGYSPVSEITARKYDIHGKAFVNYYSQVRSDLRISNSLKQDEIFRGVKLCLHFTSAEIDEMERLARETVAREAQYERMHADYLDQRSGAGEMEVYE